MTEPAIEQLRDEAFEPEHVQSDLLHKGWVWDLRTDRFGYGGSELVREYVEHPGAVAIVVLDDEQRMLMIQQYRHPIRHRDWELPAGLLDIPGEDPLEAAKRELAEEADLAAAQWQLLVSTWTTPGGNSEMIHIYLATGVTSTQHAFEREGEEADIRVEWRPIGDVVDGVLSGRLHNGILSIGALAAERILRA